MLTEPDSRWTEEERPQNDVMVKFLDFFSPCAKLAPCGPRAFVNELHARWVKANPEAARPAGSVLPRIKSEGELPTNYGFISYSREIKLEPVVDSNEKAVLPVMVWRAESWKAEVVVAVTESGTCEVTVTSFDAGETGSYGLVIAGIIRPKGDAAEPPWPAQEAGQLKAP